MILKVRINPLDKNKNPNEYFDGVYIDNNIAHVIVHSGDKLNGDEIDLITKDEVVHDILVSCVYKNNPYLLEYNMSGWVDTLWKEFNKDNILLLKKYKPKEHYDRDCNKHTIYPVLYLSDISRDDTKSLTLLEPYIDLIK